MGTSPSEQSKFLRYAARRFLHLVAVLFTLSYGLPRGAAAANLKYQKELHAAKEIAQTTALVVSSVYRRQGITKTKIKSDGSPVTDLDLLAHHLIDGALKRRFPNDVVVSEELHPNKLGQLNLGGRTWLVDPLDNTNGLTEAFKGGNEPLDVAVMIGFVSQGTPVVGAIVNPFSGLTYFGGNGLGAWKEHQGETKRVYVKVPKTITKDVKNLRIVASASRPTPILDELETQLGIAAHLKMGSFGLKAAKVAEGDADLYVTNGPYPWDTAAGSALVTEAGGFVEGLSSRPLLYNHSQRHDDYVLVSNGAHLQFIKKVLQSIGGATTR